MALPSSIHATDMSQPVANGFSPVGMFTVSTAAGASYNTSTAATNVEGTLLAFQGFSTTAGTIPAGHLNAIGKLVKFSAGGTVTNTATPNLTIAFLLGTTVIATTGVVATAAITGTSKWTAEAYGVVTAVGATGTIMTKGFFQYYTTTPVGVSWGIANTTPGTADTVDLTAAQACHVQATWGTSNASNALVCTFFSVEFLS